MNIRVTITGRDLPVACRLLEALTKAGLLDQRCTWEDNPESVVLHIEDQDGTALSAFQGKRFKAEVSN